MSLTVVEQAALTDVGRQRTSNEDRFYAAAPVFAVADGMGGARAGEVASGFAVEALDREPDGGRSFEAYLAEIARAANRRIYELAHEDDAYAGMGTTMTAVMVGDDDELAVGHVGDSRLYRLRDGSIERLTTDHSLVEEWVRAGRLEPEEAENHPQKSIITRALGPEPDVKVDTFTCPVRDGDVYLLCSDGLTGMVSEDDVAAIVRGAPSLDRAAHDLVDAANAAGGRDNITVVLLRIGVAGERSAAAEEDTLSGRPTEVGIDAAEVRAAAAAAAAERGGSRPAAAHADDTLMLDAAGAERARAGTATAERPSPAEPGRAPERGPTPAAGRRGRLRRLATVLGVLLVLGLVVAGGWLASRQVWFVGASEPGLVTLYRGLPYDGPFGLSLYEERYESTVPARTLPPAQRRRVLDHRLRSREDATDLVRQIERGRTVP